MIGKENKMQIYDVTLTVTPQMVVWPGDPKIELERTSKIEEGANHNGSRLALNVHAGTHVDAPFHFLNDGYGVDQLPLDMLIGPCQVVALPDVDVINVDALATAGIKPGMQRVLFKTRNSQVWARDEKEFQEDFVAVTADGAEFLVWQGVKLVGVDYLSVAPYKNSRETHQILLSHNVVVIEGLNLSEVPAGEYDLYCLPVKLGGSDGAPARTILIAR
jgi:arylformamidase